MELGTQMVTCLTQISNGIRCLTYSKFISYVIIIQVREDSGSNSNRRWINLSWSLPSHPISSTSTMEIKPILLVNLKCAIYIYNFCWINHVKSSCSPPKIICIYLNYITSPKLGAINRISWFKSHVATGHGHHRAFTPFGKRFDLGARWGRRFRSRRKP